jgi:hypothetical protein
MLKFLIDENLRNRAIWKAIVDWQTSLGQLYPLDAIRVGQSPGPPTGTLDEELLEFCASQNRILVSLDKDTLAGELAKRLEVGSDSPGIILIHGALSAGEIAELLALVSHACEPAELANQLCWLP